MATTTAAQRKLREVKAAYERVPAVLRAVKRYLGLADHHFAEVLKVRPQSVNGRMTGGTRLMPWDVAALATYLEMPEELLFGEPDEAISWLVEHPSKTRPRNASGPPGALNAACQLQLPLPGSVIVALDQIARIPQAVTKDADDLRRDLPVIGATG